MRRVLKNNFCQEGSEIKIRPKDKRLSTHWQNITVFYRFDKEKLK
jgi:hypothetical protein